MRKPFLVLAVCLLPGTLAAQRSRPDSEGAVAIGITVGSAGFSSGARGTSEDGIPVEFAPYHPTMSGLRFSYGRRRLRLAVSADFGSPGLSVHGSGEEPAGLLLITPNALHLAAFSAGLSAPLLRLEDGPVVRPMAGIRIERWTAPGSAARYLAGPFGGIALEFRLTKSLAASIEGEVGVTPKSPFRPEDLPEQIRPQATWRRSLLLALSWRP